MTEPRLILVAGPPASGKTSIARQLAKTLRLPLICKDTLKESLYEHLGTSDRAWSQRLGYAVICGMYALAQDILHGGASLILESPFIHPETPGKLRQLIEATGARLCVVYCYAPPEVLSERFNARPDRPASRPPGPGDGHTTGRHRPRLAGAARLSGTGHCGRYHRFRRCLCCGHCPPHRNYRTISFRNALTAPR